MGPGWICRTCRPSAASVPEGEVWWLDLESPTEEEEALIFQKVPADPPALAGRHSPARGASRTGPPHLPKVEEFSDYLFVIANPLRPAA